MRGEGGGGEEGRMGQEKNASLYEPRYMLPPPVPKPGLRTIKRNLHINNMRNAATKKIGNDQQRFVKEKYRVGYIPAPGLGKISLTPLG